MEPFTKDRPIILNRVRYAYKLFLLLDLDGTLAPASAAAPPKLKTKERALLDQLSRVALTYVGIVSERPLEQLSKTLQLPRAHYSGSLGLEYAGPADALVQMNPEEKLAPFETFAKDLKSLAAKTRSVTVERFFSYIQLDWSKAAAGPKKAFAESLQELETRYADFVRPIPGKGSAEYLPRTGYDKGTAVTGILKKVGFNLKNDLALYFGDSTPDEDAFKVVQNLGASFYVGRSNASTSARFCLKNPTEVWSLLQTIAEIRMERATSSTTTAVRMF